ncbi:DNA repair protein XRCC4 isoform X2 [Engraulis encrasicolus]|uniref:DNA repair protein XRCC4 isoform X2 n=1 Tax=Engraulis encrasicolus TaxID=184585 RepID=UPI002FD68D52
MVMDVSLRQITIASEPDRSFFLKVEWKEDFGAGFVILLCDGVSAWTGEVSEEEVSREAQEMEMSRERYVRDLQVALTNEGPAAPDYTFHLTAERGGRGHGSQHASSTLHLSYEKVQKDISFRLGAVELQPVPEPSAVVKELISHGLQRAAQLHTRNHKLQEENQRYRQQQLRINADMERYVTGKETLEKELYSRFVLVLNEKKKKIRALQARVKELETSLQEERQHRKPAAAGAGEGEGEGGEEEGGAESGGSSPVVMRVSPRRGSDYGGSTEEEEEKEEQPSTSGIKHYAKDKFSCDSPLMGDSPGDITDVAPNRKRRQRHLQQLEAQAKRMAMDQRPQPSTSRNDTHGKATAKAEDSARCPAPPTKVTPDAEDLFDDF